MKIKLQSISAKLILGGIAVVLVSLSFVGYISFSEAETALRGLSVHQAQGIASDLARMTRNTLTTEKHIAATLAAEKLLLTSWPLSMHPGSIRPKPNPRPCSSH